MITYKVPKVELTYTVDDAFNVVTEHMNRPEDFPMYLPMRQDRLRTLRARMARHKIRHIGFTKDPDADLGVWVLHKGK